MTQSAHAGLPTPVPEGAGEPPLISSTQLFQQHNTVRIEHQGQCYVLRITRENKLILTK